MKYLELYLGGCQDFSLKKTSECVVKLLMAKELSTIKFNVACENAFVIQSRGSFIHLLT